MNILFLTQLSSPALLPSVWIMVSFIQWVIVCYWILFQAQIIILARGKAFVLDFVSWLCTYDPLNISLLSGMKMYFRPILYLLSPIPGISHFSISPLFL